MPVPDNASFTFPTSPSMPELSSPNLLPNPEVNSNGLADSAIICAIWPAATFNPPAKSSAASSIID